MDFSQYDDSTDETGKDMSFTDEFSTPKISKIKVRDIYDYAENIADYDDLVSLNKAITEARLGLFKNTEAINQIERELTVAKAEYDRKWRRAYMTSNAKTETQRKAHADILCESEEDKYKVFESMKDQLSRYAATMRLELQILQTLASNLREQIRIDN